MASVRKRKWTHEGIEKEAWVVNYKDQSGNRRQKTFDKKKDADRYRTQVEGQVERGEHVASSQSALVRDVADQFIQYSKQRLENGTIGRYRFQQLDLQIRSKVIPHLGAKRFSELTDTDIDRWFGVISQGRSISSRKTYLEILHTLEDFAVRRGYTKTRVVKEFKRARVRESRDAIKTFGIADIRRLLEACEIRAPKGTRRGHLLLKIAVHLATFCGLRRGEIFGLTKDSISLDGGIIRVKSSLTSFNDLKGPKTRAGNRTVPIPPHLVGMLREWLLRYAGENERGLVFSSRTARDCGPLQGPFHKAWRALLVRAGLHAPDGAGRGLHFHALRHFAASWYMGQGMSPSDVAALLGHRTFDVTLQVYSHPIYDETHRHAAVTQSANRLLAISDARA